MATFFPSFSTSAAWRRSSRPGRRALRGRARRTCGRGTLRFEPLASDLLVLQIDREGDVRDARGSASAVRQARSATFSTCAGAHDAGAVDGDVREEPVELDVLLRVGADQVVVAAGR